MSAVVTAPGRLPASAVGLDNIPRGDPLRELPLPVQWHLVMSEGIHTAQALLAWPDGRIRQLPKLIPGCGPVIGHKIAIWLAQQRTRESCDLVHSPDAEFAAQLMLQRMRLDLAASIVRRMHRAGVSADAVAAQARTSVETVSRISNEPHGVSLEVLMRVAAALGMKVGVAIG